MSTPILLTLCVFLAIFSTCQSLKCYKCLSKEECEQDLSAQVDPEPCEVSGTAYCDKEVYTDDDPSANRKKGDVVFRTCVGHDKLGPDELCEQRGKTITCNCQEDLCNA